MSARLETNGLTKVFGDCVSVAGVSLSFEPGQIHAVLGENGAGKTTLMKLLFGLHHPTSGSISVDGQPVAWRTSMDAIARGFGMVQQHFSLVDTLSAIDNIMLGAEVCSGLGRLNRAAAIVRIEKLLPSQSLAVPWHALVSDFTVGQKQRVEILKLLFRESKILFLDEPTAVLTPLETEDFFKVLRELKAQGRTIVLITHKIGEVLAVCDTYTVMRAGKLVARGAVAGASVDSIVESMIGRKLPGLKVERTAAGSENVLQTKGLRETLKSRGHLDGISLNVRVGEIVGIAGVDGSGQNAFVESLFGLRAFAGDLRVLGENVSPFQTAQVRNLGVGLVPEDRHHQGLWLEESSTLNMAIGLEDRFLKHGFFQFGALERETSSWARELDVRASSFDKPVGSLSGGNQQKVLFAREVTGRKPRLLVCHQPTRGVDLGAIDLIHRKLLHLRNEGLGVLVISSELEELLALCDRIYVFFEGRIADEFQRAEFDAFKIGAAMTGVRHGHS
jgi:ABC-type uncharacterized transport system ATPase subunit